MEYARIPETKEYSPEATLSYDARELIKIAKAQSEKLGTQVDPITLVRRSDTDLPALQAEIANQQSTIGSAIEAVSGQAVEPEEAELDPRLNTFKADFDKDADLKAKCHWAEIQTRLLANEDHYLALAQAMEQGGQLFGVDAEGNPLISDRGDEPIMKGMNYKNTRDRVLYKHDRLDITGKMELDEDKKPISTGYEMFPYVGDYDKSAEILQYESHTGKPFVKSHNGTDFRSSWLESDEDPIWPRSTDFDPSDDVNIIVIRGDSPHSEAPNRGVRRLLRVKKA